jgi:hypothetical protein
VNSRNHSAQSRRAARVPVVLPSSGVIELPGPTGLPALEWHDPSIPARLVDPVNPP